MSKMCKAPRAKIKGPVPSLCNKNMFQQVAGSRR